MPRTLPLMIVLLIPATTLLRGQESRPAAGAAGWSRFRGPNGSGRSDSTGLPTRLDVGRNLRWKTALPPGHSSPVLAGERIFVTAFGENKLWTIALDRKSGEIRWRRETPRPRVTKVDKRNNAASPTPAADADVVVSFFEDFGLVAHDHDGGLLWRHPLGPFDNFYGMGASPVLVGDLAILPCDQNRNSFLIAVGRRDGKVRWKMDRPWARSGHCTPVIYRPKSGGPQLILPGSFYLDGYDVATGKRLWWVSGLSFEMKSTPVLHDGIVYINGYGSPMNQPGNQVKVPDFRQVLEARDADGDGVIGRKEMPPGRATAWFGFVDLDRSRGLDAGEWRFLQDALASQNGLLAIRAGGSGDMTGKSVLWAYRRSVPQLPSPLLAGGLLYVLNDQGGLIAQLDPKSGKLVRRGRLKGAIDSYYASPVAGDGKVYCVSEQGLVSVLKAGGDLESLAVSDLGEPCYASPAIADGRLYVRTTAALYCFGRP